MEFDEIQKIWNTQNNELFYGINEKALHNRILAKKNQGRHITNISELLTIIVYTITGCFVIAINVFIQRGNISMYILGVWMIVVAIYLLVSRIRRIHGDNRFDRTMRGDLLHAISVATYQVRLSRLMQWNILPIGILIISGIGSSGKSIWFAVGFIIFFVLTAYASRWEHRIYKNRKRELIILQGKLDNEIPAELSF